MIIKRIFSLIFIFFVLFISLWFLFAKSKEPKVFQVEIPSGISRWELADILAEELSWNRREKESFVSAYTQMKWTAFGNYVADFLSDEMGWTKEEKEIFLTSTMAFGGDGDDPFISLYVPDFYFFESDNKNPVLVAGTFVSKIKENEESLVREMVISNISEDVAKKLSDYVRKEFELLPDITPLPPSDIILERNGDRVFLRFSTTYYNKGRGPLEFIADPSTAGIAEDIERNIFQRVYLPDGGYRDFLSGTFLWHQEHLHYHFEDFAYYELEPLDSSDYQNKISMKSTFCVRDVSRVDIQVDDVSEARYLICGKERQGISVGWGDTYFYNYPDQLFDVTDLPVGNYKLSFIINPYHIFEEYDLDNNVSSSVLFIDSQNLDWKILFEEPSSYPELEHVYPKQDCKNCTL